jgi:hypothetical protein
MKILITGVGGPTPRSFAISLLKYGNIPELEIIGTDINPLSIGLYQNDLFKHTRLIAPASDPNAYWADIGKLIADYHIDLAVILPELEVLAWSKRLKEGTLPCKALIPDLSLAELLVDKAKMTEVLMPLGVVPASVAFKRDETNIDAIFDRLGSEFWVRSSAGTSGLGSLKVDSPDALRNWIQINPGVDNFLASQYLPGRNLACKLLYFEGELIRSASAERVNYIMAKVAPSGITGNTSFGRLLKEPELVETAVKAMESLFSATGAKKHGFFTADFKEDSSGTPFITEINVRHVAFTQCFAAGGANFASDTVRLLFADQTFDRNYKMYEFEKDLIFLRDVDSLPVLMKETDLLSE